ncbi:SusC/RagA family TonB-linked outer membrane protein [uncultured Tenacibaculum sp.]|uniref:SusC/RagA family TonB-linked outer membrane protein n=1 Tax=uncultured Tenacibaculum sp. TaxID=174713 RepID=UPI00260CB4AB|nr:SusC/RagA family TonB-linked outer membrane protein [uncultured Tenacibaculum sp.]
MKTKFNGILTLLLALVVQISFAQDRTISGTVSDESGPLPGVSVLKKGTTSGTETDFDGKYSIKAKTGDVIVFSFVGMKTVERVVGSSNSINVSMESDNLLEEVIVEGAYDIRRSKPTVNTSITSLGAETIEGRPNASLVQTIQGQAPGVNITTGSGQPGANSEVIIRGVGSINGNTEPLFIIDGVPVDGDNFRSLNPNNIESMTILKDAGAKSVYGNRGANGVIIIKTKSGKFNTPTTIEYNLLTSISELQSNNLNLLDSRRMLELERTFGNGRGSGLTDAEIAQLSQTNTEWLDIFFRRSITQSHNLRISSGSEKTTTNVNLGYFDSQGILVQSGLQRFNLDAKINGRSDNEKFKYGTSISLNYSKNNEPNAIGGGGVNRNFVLGAYQSLPYISPSEYVVGQGGSIAPIFANTPLLLLDRLATYERREDELKAILSLNASYELYDGLTLGSRLGMDYTHETTLRAEFPNSFNSVFFAQTGNTTPGTQDQQTTRAIGVNWLNSLNYSTKFGEDHSLDVGAYMEVFKAHLDTFGFRANGLDPKTFSPGDGSGFVDDNATNDFFIDQANANINNAGLLSFFATADYDYKKKYGFGATVRRDASFRFRDSNRWGTFWSVSGRWNIDQESFMDGSAFDLLKLRASYGTTGNQDITTAVGFNQYFVAATRTQSLFSTGAGYGGANAIFINQPGNPDLKWETTTESNIGVDFEVFNRKLSGSLDVYERETSDLFVSQPVQSLFGATSLEVNSDGIVRNTGVDLFLRYTPISTPDLRVSANFAGNYNKSERFGANLTTVREGGPIGEFFSVRYAGVNPANGNLLFLDANDNLTETPDADNDRVFTNKTRFPDYQGSFGFDVDYKGFFLQTSFNFVIGADRVAGNYANAVNPNNIGNFRLSEDLLDFWTPDNRVTDVPALRASNLGLASDRFIQSADYLRLRFVSLGYNFPRDIVKQFKLSKIRTFINGENLVTISGFRDFDVEGFGNTSRTFPTPRTISFGFEIGF